MQALKAGFEQSFAAQGKVTEALKKLKPLDEFCKEQLTGFLKGKWRIDFDVERDTLDITKKIYTSIIYRYCPISKSSFFEEHKAPLYK